MIDVLLKNISFIPAKMRGQKRTKSDAPPAGYIKAFLRLV